MKKVELLKCSCGRIYNYWDASGRKCLDCGVTMTGNKAEKILDILVYLGYLKRNIRDDASKSKTVVYNIIREVYQEKHSKYLVF